jgi:hypothetical protein
VGLDFVRIALCEALWSIESVVGLEREKKCVGREKEKTR